MESVQANRPSGRGWHSNPLVETIQLDGMTEAEQAIIDAIGEAVRVMLLGGEQAPLPGLGTLGVNHVPSRQVRDSRGTVVTAPASVIEFEIRDVVDTGVLARAASIATAPQDSVAAVWKGLLDSPLRAIHLPGVGNFAVVNERLEFSANPALQHAINARYTGYVDLAIVHGGDRIDVAGDAPPEDSQVLPDFERIVDEAVPADDPEAFHDDVDEDLDSVDSESLTIEPWPDHAIEDEAAAAEPERESFAESSLEPLPESLPELLPDPEPGWTEQIETANLADLAREADEDLASARVDAEEPLTDDAVPAEPSQSDDSEQTGPSVTRPRPKHPARPEASRRVPIMVATAVVLVLLLAFLYNRFFLTSSSDTAPVAEEVAAAPAAETAQETGAAADLPTEAADPVGTTDANVSEVTFTRGAINVSQGGFTLIVGSKTTEREAAEVAAALSVGGNPVDILEAEVDGSTRYRVAVGQFRTFALASRALNQNADSLPEGSWIGRIE